LPVSGKDLIAGFTFKTPMFYGFDKALGQLIDPDQPHELAKTQDDALTVLPLQNLPVGSQGIAIAPSRSEDGFTHLLVNSHQPLTGPVAWYEARLHSEEGWNVVGSTFPGAPVIIHGHNENLGWSNTVNKPDLVDFYKLSINPENENEYLLDGQWQTFEHKTASMLVKLFGPIRWTFTKDIKISQHGPVMETEHGMYAARWAGMDEVRTLEFMYDMNKANTQQEFENVLAMNAMPSINYVYADKEGNIAHYYNAMFPDRIDGWEWDKILPGDRSELIWQGYRDFSMMPKTVNPKTGLVYNANNPPFMATDGDDDAQAKDYPVSMGIESFVTNRALQIEALAKIEEKISLAELKQIKFDDAYHPMSHQIQTLNRWLANLDLSEFNEQELSALNEIKQWNRKADKLNPRAALAIITMGPIQKANGDEVPFTDITASFKQAVADLIKYHGNVLVAYGDVFRLIHGDKNLAISGGPDTLRAVYGKALNEQGQAENKAGDGFMMFVSWDQNGLVYSESAHQYGSATLDESSPHYNDQMEMFVNEELRLVPFHLHDLAGQVTRRYRPGRALSEVASH
jgi:penicillin amidase/acyl-homoserine-lactone acylase